jgi:hypothetical protein
MVQASLRVQSGRRRADQRAQEEIWPGALSLPHGEDGMGRWVGWGIVVHNLAKISEAQAERAAT